jgi:radical SAM superfamily enzyme YgiQ (UPF0313 family)
LRRITFIRPNLADVRASDAMTPLVFSILAARTPKRIALELVDERLEPVRDRETDLVAMTVETFTARRAYEIADRYRARGVPVVMGGYHPTLMPDEASGHADAIVIGDAEGAWEQLIEDFEAGELKPVYRGDAKKGLDGIVYDRSIFRGKRYAPLTLIQAGRGCRFACDFCSIHAFYGSNVQYRPLDDILREVSATGKRRPIFFVDDNLYGRRAEFVAFMRALRPLGRRWCCQISIDVARDDELLDLMAEAGCFLALIGFESVTRESLVQMGKRWNGVAGDYADVVERFRKRRIAIYGTFVVGYDADGPGAFDAILDFAQRAKLGIGNFNALTPMPGTRLYDRLKAQGRMTRDRWWLDPEYRYGETTFSPALIGPDDLSERCYRARKSFYGVGSIARRMFTAPELLRSPWLLGLMLLANGVSRKEIHRKQNRPLGRVARVEDGARLEAAS